MKNSQKGFLSIMTLIIVVAVLFVGGGTYVAVKNQEKQQRYNVPQITQKVINEPNQNNPVSNKKENQNWKSYTNSELGFTVSYPSTYHIYLDHNLINYDENKYERGNTNGVKIQVQKHNNENLGYNLSTSDGVKRFIDKLNDNRAKNDELESANTTPITPFSFGILKYKNKVLSGPGGSFNMYYAFANSDIYYTILVWGETNDQEIVNKILSTFKIK